jgi:hypothetical protein
MPASGPGTARRRGISESQTPFHIPVQETCSQSDLQTTATRTRHVLRLLQLVTWEEPYTWEAEDAPTRTSQGLPASPP